MTVEFIATLVGILVALGLEYIPGFKDWYNTLPNVYQKLLAAGLGFVVVAGAFGLGCANLIAPYWPCTAEGAWSAFVIFAMYIAGNQGTFALFLKKDSAGEAYR